MNNSKIILHNHKTTKIKKAENKLRIINKKFVIFKKIKQLKKIEITFNN